MPDVADLYAVTMCRWAPMGRASAAAISTAFSAVDDPSVPTTTILYMTTPFLGAA